MIADKTLHTLEFDKVLQRLAAHTSFSLSRDMVAQLRPSTELEEVQQLQDQVSEALRLVSTRADISLGGAHDIRAGVSRAALGGSLDPMQLLDVQSTLECSERLRVALSRLEAETNAWLTSQRARLGTFRDITELIGQTINDQGEVLDSASPATGKDPF